MFVLGQITKGFFLDSDNSIDKTKLIYTNSKSYPQSGENDRVLKKENIKRKERHEINEDKVVESRLCPKLEINNITNDTAKLIGKWVNEDEKDNGYFEFDSEGYAYISVNDQIMGGKSFVQNGKKGKMTYDCLLYTSPSPRDA